jgi:hypothetical protein
MRQSSDTNERPRFDLSVPKVVAGALAAASAAVAASWLGVAGTVVGAVIASVVVSVTSALYSRPLERSSRAIRQVIPVTTTARYRAPGAAGVAETIVIDRAEPPASEPDGPGSQPRRRIRWAAVALSAVVMLVAGFAIVTGVEAVLGRPVSAIGGDGSGTTLGRLVDRSQGGSGGSDSTPSNGGPTGDTTRSPTTGPSEEPTTTAPTTAPTTSEPTETEPAPTGATEPTEPAAPAETAPAAE